MRTKALLGAAILAAGLASSMAQNVYSLNVVGYHNVTVPANSYALIANHMVGTNYTLNTLIPNPPPASTFFKYTTGSGYTPYVFDEFDLVWAPNGNVTLAPGEGGFFKNPTASSYTITFVGEVSQGNLTNTIPAGYSVRSSIVPQAGKVTTDLAYPAAAADTLFKYTPGTGYTPYVFDEFDLAWAPTEPSLAVGESFFVLKQASANWVRNFTVPQN